jgi:hypothetical protein
VYAAVSFIKVTELGTYIDDFISVIIYVVILTKVGKIGGIE